MTKEQIAKLRRGAEIIAKEWTSAPPSMDSPRLLLRALDEREALLAALCGLIEFANSPAAKAVDMSAWVHGVKYRPEDVAAWDVARDAIAKAEAE